MHAFVAGFHTHYCAFNHVGVFLMERWEKGAEEDG